MMMMMMMMMIIIIIIILLRICVHSSNITCVLSHMTIPKPETPRLLGRETRDAVAP